MRFPFTASEESVSIFLNGRMHNLASTLRGFTELVEHLKGSDHDAEFIENIIDRPSMVARLTAGAVTVVGSTVFHNGIPAHSTLTVKLIEMLDAGFDAGPWINFFIKVMQNPSERSRQCLYDFLDKWKAPLTPCGDFIAFKYVSDDYMDQRTGTFDNHPGQSPSMPRDMVDSNPDATCSRGLHVCASVYLSEYNVGARIVAVQVNPANVVAVPSDYNHAKMRVCEYLVLSDVENPHDGGIAKIEAQQVYVPEDYSGGTFDDDPNDPSDDDTYTSEMAAADNAAIADNADNYDGWDNHPDLEVIDPVDISDLQLLAGSYESGEDPVWFRGGIFDATVGLSTLRFIDANIDDMGNGGTVTDCLKRLYAAGEGTITPKAAELAESPEILGGPFFTTTTGDVYSANVISAGVAAMGQRGYASYAGIPRSTLQGWLSSLAK